MGVNDIEHKVIDIRKLLAISSKIDFEKSKVEGPVVEILERLFPEIPKDKLIAIESDVTEALEARSKSLKGLTAQCEKSKKGNFKYLKLTLSFAAVVAGYYYGAPIAVRLTDSALNQIYILLFGVPHPKSLTYAILAPSKKFLGFISNTYGPYVFAAIAGPATYCATSAIESIYNCVHFLTSLLSPTKTTKEIEEITREFELMELSEPKASVLLQNWVKIDDYLPLYAQTNPMIQKFQELTTTKETLSTSTLKLTHIKPFNI